MQAFAVSSGAVTRVPTTAMLMGLPPTNKTATVPVMLIYRIADDKIVEHWMVADQMSLMQQLGAIPAPG